MRALFVQKHTPFILLLQLFCCGLTGQKAFRDSLIRLLPNEMTDSARVKINIQIARKFNRVNNDSAIYYLDQAVALAQEKNIAENTSTITYLYGIFYKNSHKYEQSLTYLNRYLELDEIQEKPRLKAHGLYSLGLLNYEMSSLEASMKYAQEAITYY